MASQNRQSTTDLTPDSALLKKIQNAPWRYDFFQLIRILEHYREDADPGRHASTHNNQAKAASNSAPVGSFYPPHEEPVRFSMNPSMSFKSASVSSLNRGGADQIAHNKQWQVEVNFWGLVGSKGVLPFHYRELVLQRLRSKDVAMKHFFDIFDHRSLSLFYRAWKKYRVAIIFEAHQRLDPKYNRDRYNEMIRGLLGLASKPDANFYQPGGAELNCAGLISRRICSPAALTQAIKQQFGLAVQILPYQGQWQAMPEDVQTRTGSLQGRNHILGQQAILGEKTWSIQNRFTVQIQDIDYDRFIKLVSGTEMLRSMYSLIRTMAGVALDFDLSLEVQQRKLPTSRLADAHTPPLLGWNTKVHGDYPAHKYITVAVSRHAMRRTLSQR